MHSNSFEVTFSLLRLTEPDLILSLVRETVKVAGYHLTTKWVASIRWHLLVYI